MARRAPQQSSTACATTRGPRRRGASLSPENGRTARRARRPLHPESDQTGFLPATSAWVLQAARWSASRRAGSPAYLSADATHPSETLRTLAVEERDECSAPDIACAMSREAGCSTSIRRACPAHPATRWRTGARSGGGSRQGGLLPKLRRVPCQVLPRNGRNSVLPGADLKPGQGLHGNGRRRAICQA